MNKRGAAGTWTVIVSLTVVALLVLVIINIFGQKIWGGAKDIEELTETAAICTHTQKTIEDYQAQLKELYEKRDKNKSMLIFAEYVYCFPMFKVDITQGNTDFIAGAIKEKLESKFSEGEKRTNDASFDLFLVWDSAAYISKHTLQIIKEPYELVSEECNYMEDKKAYSDVLDANSKALKNLCDNYTKKLDTEFFKCMDVFVEAGSDQLDYLDDEKRLNLAAEALQGYYYINTVMDDECHEEITRRAEHILERMDTLPNLEKIHKELCTLTITNAESGDAQLEAFADTNCRYLNSKSYACRVC